MTTETEVLETEARAAESFRVAGQAVLAVGLGYGIGTIGPLASGAGMWVDPDYAYPGPNETPASIRATMKKTGGHAMMKPKRAQRYTDSILIALAGRIAEQLHRPESDTSAASVRDLEVATEMARAYYGEGELVTNDDVPGKDIAAGMAAAMGTPENRAVVQIVAARLLAGETVTGAEIRSGGMAQ